MTNDRTEQLIRDVFTDEAARAVDSREVLAAVRGRKPRKSYGLVLTTVAVVVVVAAVATFVVPEVFSRSAPPAADGSSETTTQAVTPTNVLVVGVDPDGNTDSIVLAGVTENGTNLISLPRDSWVSSAGTMTRLNQIYKNAGAEALTAAVRDLTGVLVDHYAVVETAAVVDLTNAVGGVPVCLNSPTSDRYSGADFAAGEQTLNGDAALAFIRQRHGLPNGDLDRIARLQAFLRSLLTQLDGKELPALLTAVSDHVQFDPGLDVVRFVQAVSGENLHFGTIPITNSALQVPESGSVVEVDPAQVKEFVTGLPNTPAVAGVPCVN